MDINNIPSPEQLEPLSDTESINSIYSTNSMTGISDSDDQNNDNDNISNNNDQSSINQQINNNIQNPLKVDKESMFIKPCTFWSNNITYIFKW